MKRRLGATLAVLVATLVLSGFWLRRKRRPTSTSGPTPRASCATNRPNTNPGAKLYIKSTNPSGTPRPGVTPFAPQDRDLSRYTRFDEYIRQAAALYQIPEQLVRAVIKVESDYDPRAVSYAGARGLMQLMPENAPSACRSKTSTTHARTSSAACATCAYSPTCSTAIWTSTVAAYNAGEGAVVAHGGFPASQTRDYVVKVTKFYRRYRTIGDIVEASVGQPGAGLRAGLGSCRCACRPVEHQRASALSSVQCFGRVSSARRCRRAKASASCEGGAGSRETPSSACNECNGTRHARATASCRACSA